MRYHPTDVAVGHRLATARIALGLSQDEVAKRLEDINPDWFSFDRTIIGRIETGRRPVRLRELGALAQVLQCDWYWIVTGSYG